jgi:DNA-binding NarL/FixJ family response regulator
MGVLAKGVPTADQAVADATRLGDPQLLSQALGVRVLLRFLRDVDSAVLTAREALRHHERIPMPFEKARTLLVLGQLERRQRHREAATTALRAALDEFERLKTPLWAERARTELARTELARTDVATIKGGSDLTVSERRVAELAAKGMTNRDVAAALFISPKTVEANLVRIYRKLGIHSRAELGRQFGESEP